MAASRTDSARAPSLDSGTHDLIADSMAIGWAVFTSPLTLMALLGLLAGVLGFGAAFTI